MDREHFIAFRREPMTHISHVISQSSMIFSSQGSVSASAMKHWKRQSPFSTCPQPIMKISG